MRMKRITTYHLSPILLLLVLEAASFAQVPAANKANAKLAGRIIIDGQPALAIQVLLKKRDSQEDLASASTQSPAVSAITNADGRYQITNLAAGAYRVSVYAPAYVIEGESLLSYEYGKNVSIAEGEQIENLDFSLMRGGVITGKVTDDYGKPVIAEGVGAFRLDQQGKRDNTAAVQMLRWQTDDRGVYRIFGLEPGRYVIGVGASSKDSLQPIGNRGSYRRTYHPDVVDEPSAKIIEVKPGGEVENVDIKLSRATKSYTASGRVIDAETSKPLPAVTIGCEFAKAAGSNFRMGDTTTNSNGEFRIEGLSPNTYIASVFNPGPSDLYSDPVKFDVADDDVVGLEIKMIRGASISGLAEVEGTRDPSVLALLSQVAVRAEGTSQETAMLIMMLMQGGGVGTINSNGTLRIAGVRPGRTRIVALPPPELKGFTLARVERNGAEIKDFNVAQGEQITGVRLVFTYGTSVLAGHVEIKGGALPLNAQMTVRIVREGVSPDEWWFAKQANVDARGQFSIEGVSEGNYKAYLMIFTNDTSSPPNFPRIEQSVSIPADVRREITLVLDLSKEGNQ
ncbi:MAG TPA: carboxypeptidase-like regulatory domain-containing protein [Pyrinomonadaceae bacterium]